MLVNRNVGRGRGCSPGRGATLTLCPLLAVSDVAPGGCRQLWASPGALLDLAWAAGPYPGCRWTTTSPVSVPSSWETPWHVHSWQSSSQALNHFPQISRVLTHVMGLVGGLQSFFFSIYEILWLPMASGPLRCLSDTPPINFPWLSLSSLKISIFMHCYWDKGHAINLALCFEFAICL